MNTTLIISVVLFLISIALAVPALYFSVKNRQDIVNKVTTGEEIIFTPVPPTLTSETNVQSALERLNLVATSSSNGLMSPRTSRKLECYRF